jgi:ubiquinone/menaquinone biosynthesis C-methylase UbiE
MRSATELKQIFQAGWNVPARVENYSRGVIEFTEGATHVAWRSTLAAALGADRQLKVLDVGTGPGIFACLYSQMGHSATGLDFSERMLAVARRRAVDLGLDCEFVFGDAEEPPFDDATFDAVSSRHVLFNLPRPGVAIRHWVRVLKPGGRLILMGNEHDSHAPKSLAARGRKVVQWCRMRWARRRRGPQSWATPDYRQAVAECPLFRHGSGTLRAVMEAAGLEQIHVQPTDAIQAARRSSPTPKSRRRFVAPGQFFMLVGRKP